MLTTRTFPTLLIILDIFAAGGYAWHDLGDWRKIGYWLSAAVLTYCVNW